MTWQRCIVHLERDVLSSFSRIDKRKRVSKALKAVFKEREGKLVRKMYRKTIVEIGKIDRRARELLEDTRDDALAILTYTLSTISDCVPTTYKSMPTVRSKAVQTFSSKKSLLRLIGAICVDMNDKWAQSVLWMYRTKTDGKL